MKISLEGLESQQVIWNYIEGGLKEGFQGPALSFSIQIDDILALKAGGEFESNATILVDDYRLFELVPEIPPAHHMEAVGGTGCQDPRLKEGFQLEFLFAVGCNYLRKEIVVRMHGTTINNYYLAYNTF